MIGKRPGEIGRQAYAAFNRTAAHSSNPSS
ncbi:hypothetical protein GGQ88_004042 [Novosphingobium hassiacum]|uniref:Uncharacterized protein n=1 Tax=Novosphingobium hassiacum TaxID=173676 RepID=A0A7W6A3U3_9SPHN|nr:hypothetical protein [Novosphingobium hassiacum]